MSLVSQMRGLIFLYFKSSRPSSIKPLSAYLCKPHFKRYSSEGASNKDQNTSSTAGVHLHPARHERAPSTAEEFKRVAEEKLRAARRKSDEGYDGAEEAAAGDSSADSVKNRFKEHEQGADHPRRGGD